MGGRRIPNCKIESTCFACPITLRADTFKYNLRAFIFISDLAKCISIRARYPGSL